MLDLFCCAAAAAAASTTTKTRLDSTLDSLFDCSGPAYLRTASKTSETFALWVLLTNSFLASTSAFTIEY